MTKERRRLANAVVRLREKQQLSWLEIGAEVERSPATCRRLYDEVRGDGAHVGLLPGKGGRLPAAPVKKVRQRKAA